MLLHFVLFYLKVCQFELIAADALGSLRAALRTLKLVAGHVKFTATDAALPPWTNLYLQLQRIEIGVPSQDLESELQSVSIYRRQFADPNCDFARLPARMQGGLGSNRVKNRIGDSDFVHDPLNKSVAVDPRPAYRQCA
jgi:hypothetical protein